MTGKGQSQEWSPGGLVFGLVGFGELPCPPWAPVSPSVKWVWPSTLVKQCPRPECVLPGQAHVGCSLGVAVVCENPVPPLLLPALPQSLSRGL